MVQTIDRVEDGRITWMEFATWMIKEGRVRNIANDQRLFTFTVARIQETAFFRIQQYSIPRMEPIDVEPLSGKTMHLYLVIQDDENCSCQIFAETNMTKSLYTFDFESLYRNPKPIDAFPGL
jgi:hypothetical protein